MSLRIIFTALPNGINKENGNLKISIVANLQITDANNGATLAQFPDVLQWPTILNKAQFFINGVEAKKVNLAVEEKLWKDLFTSSVKVQSYKQPDLSKKPIYSYPIKHIVDYLDKASQAIGKKYFNDMPDANFYTENELFQSISNYSVGNKIPRNERKKIGLEEIAKFNFKGDLVKRRFVQRPFIPFSNQAEPAIDFAQLCNFHGMYNAKPVNTMAAIPKPDFEFHDILSVLTQYNTLQRKLGLVIDVEVASTNVSGNIIACPNNLHFTSATELVLPTTATELTSNGFYTRAEADSIYDKGYVKIDTDQFTVFQIDTDGGALKLTAHMDALLLKKAKHILYASENNVMDIKAIPFLNNELQSRKEGLPSSRTTGIAIAKNGLGQYLNTRFERMNQLKNSTSVFAPPNGVLNNNVQYKTLSAILYADDVIAGYRMDIKSGLQNNWLSVHFTNNIYQYKNNQGAQIPISVNTVEEGYVQLTTTEDKKMDEPHMKLSEVLVRWEGWSLAAPPAGKGINDPMLSSKEIEENDATEKKKFDTPDTQPFQLNVQPSVAKGTLPKLRFGNAYAIKLRTVDLAGNSVSHLQEPDYGSRAVVSGIRYLRYEPTEVPFLYYGNKVKDGESSEVMVIRSNEGVSVFQYESKWSTAYKDVCIRHVLPPRIAVGTAVTHGMMDAVVGIGGQAAKDLYDFIITKKDKITPTNASPQDAKVLNGDNGYGPIEYLTDPLAAGIVLYLAPSDSNPKNTGFEA